MGGRIRKQNRSELLRLGRYRTAFWSNETFGRIDRYNEAASVYGRSVDSHYGKSGRGTKNLCLYFFSGNHRRCTDPWKRSFRGQNAYLWTVWKEPFRKRERRLLEKRIRLGRLLSGHHRCRHWRTARRKRYHNFKRYRKRQAAHYTFLVSGGKAYRRPYPNGQILKSKGKRKVPGMAWKAGRTASRACRAEKKPRDTLYRTAWAWKQSGRNGSTVWISSRRQRVYRGFSVWDFILWRKPCNALWLWYAPFQQGASKGRIWPKSAWKSNERPLEGQCITGGRKSRYRRKWSSKRYQNRTEFQSENRLWRRLLYRPGQWKCNLDVL